MPSTNKISLKAYLALAWPIMLAGLSSPLLGLADQSFLGQFAQANQIAALSLALVLMSYVFWGFNFISLGLSGHTSQALGANDFVLQKKRLFQFSLLSGLLACFVLVISPWMIPWASRLIDQSGELHTQIAQYLYIRIFSTPALVINLIGFGWCVGNQNTFKPMLIMISTNVINICLDWYFCLNYKALGLSSTLQGVALGTVIAEYLAALCYLYIIFGDVKKMPSIKTTHWIVFNELWQLIKSSSHFVIRSIFLLSVFAWFSYLASSLGAEIVAANAIFLVLLTLMATGLDGFAHAGEAQIGKFAGAKDSNAIKQVLIISFMASLLLALCFVLLMAGFANTFVFWISNDQVLTETARNYHIWLVLLPLTAFSSYWLDGILTGLKASHLMRNQVVLSSLVYFPVSYYLLFLWGNHGIWLVLNGFMVLRSLIGIFMLRRVIKTKY
jgi:multidrug resistance protein, MATE family